MARGAFTVEQVAGDTSNANPVSCFIVQKYLFVGYDNGSLKKYERKTGIIYFNEMF